MACGNDQMERRRRLTIVSVKGYMVMLPVRSSNRRASDDWCTGLPFGAYGPASRKWSKSESGRQT